jgi:hypothetical protein
MNCKREPEPFESDTGITCYWMVTPKGDDEPTILMSNMELMFQVSPEMNYIAKDGEYFQCIKCFESIYSEIDKEPTK